MDGQNGRGLKPENGLHLGKFEKRRPTFFSNLRYVTLNMYQNVIYTAGKSFSVVMWP